MATYLGGNIGIDKGGLVSMRPPSNAVIDAVRGRGSSGGSGGRSGGGGGGSSGQSQDSSNKAAAEKAAQEAAANKAIVEALASQEKQESLRRQMIGAKLTQQSQPVNIQMNPPLSLEPQIYQRQVGTFTAPDTGKQIPIIEIRYAGGVGKGIGLVEDRLATKEEADYYKQQTNKLQASEQKPNKIGRAVGEFIGVAKQNIYQTNVAGSETLQSVGLTDKNIEAFAKYSSYATPISMVSSNTQQFIQGAISNTIKGFRDKPVTNVALLGVGAGVGFVAKGLPIATDIVFGIKAAKYVNVATTTVGIGLTASYVAGAGARLVQAKSPKEAGEITGDVLRETLLFGGGFKAGTKGANYLGDLYFAKGRTFYEGKQGEYPSAPANEHLKLFKSNIIKEFGNEPGAFHTTSEIFWEGKKISPKAGTSEIPGLYASTQISTPFSRIQGSGSSSVPIIDRINLKAFKELFAYTRPAVAFLKPLGFREVSAGKVKPYFVGEQKFKYAFFEKAKEGYADIPKIKNEIETIFRAKAGDYAYESGKFYTEIKGRKVPIDVFKYDKMATEKLGVEKTKTLEGSDYSMPKSSSASILGLTSVSKGLGSSRASSSRGSSSSVPSSSLSSYSSSVSLSSIGGSSRGLSSSDSSLSKSFSYSKSLSSGSSNGQSYKSLKSSLKPMESYNPGGLKLDSKFSYKQPKSFNILARRFGKFKQIGSTSDINKAFDIGAGYTRRTLGASFTIKGNGSLKIPKGYYAKQEKIGTVFIQKNKLRLSSFGEKSEIKSARRRKKK
jgi:hypothetical protein